MRWAHSIRLHIVLLLSAFVCLVCCVATVSTIGVVTIDRHTKQISHKWLAGTQLLGELSNHVAEFRLAETLFALAPDLSSAQNAKRLAQFHRDAIDRIARDYVDAVGSHAVEGDLRAFLGPWHKYIAMHDAWIASADAVEAASLSSGSGTLLDTSYQAADAAVKMLTKANASAALDETIAADEETNRLIRSVVLCSAVAIALALLIAVLSQKYLVAPLRWITHAMGQLAGGRRDVDLPAMPQIDEVVNLARAFDVFRANLFALEDAHEQTRAAQKAAQSLARHDALTGLPNRRVFSQDLDAAVQDARRGRSHHALVLVDLDRFKAVNDSRGHSIGDQVLCEVARRLAMLGSGNAARLGGDEFAIILQVSAEARLDIEAIGLAEDIQNALRVPIPLEDFHIEIGSSIGIARCSGPDACGEALLRCADIAMYHAKHGGRDTFRIFEQEMDDALQGEALVEDNLRKAIRDVEIVPYYQPLIDFRTNQVCALEILARWETSPGVFTPPSVFVPKAERLGLIQAMTFSLLRQACQDARIWPSHIRLALNISPIHLIDPALPLRILTILNATGFAPHRLEIEVTESALIADFDSADQNIRALRGLGITIAIDDFGTGYSSLQHLARLQFDTLKIDRSFIDSIETNSESGKIVTAVLSLAKSLGLPTVAEGIETKEVRDRMIAMGCDYGQGYYFGRAIDAGNVGSFWDPIGNSNLMVAS